MNLVLIGKEKGEYQGHKYFKLYFTRPIGENGEGCKPFMVNKRKFDGTSSLVNSVSCVSEIYDSLPIGEVIEDSDFYFDSKGRAVALE